MTTTITEPAGSPAPETAPGFPDSLRLPGGWGRPRTPLPGRDNPDPAPETTRTTGAEHVGDSTSSEQAASTRALFKGRAKSYAKIAEVLFKAVGGLLNNAAAAAAGDTDAWLPDVDDIETVAPPVGRLAARRLKIGVDPEQLGDLEDIGMAAVGLLIWAAKGVSAVAEARRYRRRLEADRAMYAERGDGQ